MTGRGPTSDACVLPPGLSVLEAKVYRHLADHVAAETDAIDAYRQLCEDEHTPAAARYLIRLLLDDEQRHHRVLGEIVAALGNSTEWGHDPGAVPDLPVRDGTAELAQATRRFIAAEREDAKRLKALRRELAPFKDTTAWVLLVETMEQDTAKHIRLLRFIAERVARVSL